MFLVISVNLYLTRGHYISVMSKLKKCYVILGLAMLLVFGVAGCGSSAENSTWPDSGLGAILPKPDAKKIDIGYNLEDSFSADIEKANEQDFTAYVAKCEEAGFTVDADSIVLMSIQHTMQMVMK